MLTFDMRAFEQAAQSMRAAQDQVPFAVSSALNTAVLKTENRLASETWARHTANRNKSFFKAAMKPEFANKRQLRVALVDSLGRAKLQEHSHGGTVQAKGRFAIPTAAVTRTARGVRQNQRPGNLSPKDKVVKGGLIFAPQGRGKNRKLTLLYKLQAQVRIKKDIPLVEDFNRFMREEARVAFPKAMLKAMRTRR